MSIPPTDKDIVILSRPGTRLPLRAPSLTEASVPRTAVPFLGPISASKAALESLSDAARVELAQWRIPVVLVEPGAMDTPIFAKADAAARAPLAAAPPERLALYQPALAAVAMASAKQKRSPVSIAVAAIVKAVQAGKPNARYVAGRDASTLVMLLRLPAGRRDRLLASNLGLAKLDAGRPR